MSEIVILHGAPGSGKTTHAEKFVKQYPDRVFHISIGNHLRSIRLGKTTSRFKKDIEKQADLLSQSIALNHEVVNGVVFEFIEQCPSLATVLIDGFPRFLEQLPFFYKSIESQNHLYLGLVLLRISAQTSLFRLTHRGTRPGEKEVEESFAKWRFEEYQKKILPTIAALTTEKKLIEIDADQAEDDVWNAFNQTVSSLIFKKVQKTP